MPDSSPESEPGFIQEQIDRISQMASQQAALLDISRAVQDIEHIDDLEHVVRVMFGQMKNIGLDFAGLAFQRLIDAKTQTFELHHMRPDGVYQKQTQSRPVTFREWQMQQVLYRRDLALLEHRKGLPEGYQPVYQDLGLHIQCILHVPNPYGILTLRSETPQAFSDAQVGFIGDFTKMLGLAISRVEDLERLETRNAELAQANTSLKEEIAERKRAEAALVETERLQALMETAGAAAHEINQPLTVIIGLSRLVMDNLPKNDPIRNDLHDIMGAGMTISRILKKMQNIRQYATRPYVGDTKIVDFEEAGGKDEDRSE